MDYTAGETVPLSYQTVRHECHTLLSLTSNYANNINPRPTVVIVIKQTLLRTVTKTNKAQEG